ETVEAEFVPVVRESRRQVRGEELRRDVADHGAQDTMRDELTRSKAEETRSRRKPRSKPFRSHEKRCAGLRHRVGLGAPTRVPTTLSRSSVFPACGAAFRSE